MQVLALQASAGASLDTSLATSGALPARLARVPDRATVMMLFPEAGEKGPETQG